MAVICGYCSWTVIIFSFDLDVHELKLSLSFLAGRRHFIPLPAHIISSSANTCSHHMTNDPST
jgi:hypothetical protein